MPSAGTATYAAVHRLPRSCPCQLLRNGTRPSGSSNRTCRASTIGTTFTASPTSPDAVGLSTQVRSPAGAASDVTPSDTNRAPPVKRAIASGTDAAGVSSGAAEPRSIAGSLPATPRTDEVRGPAPSPTDSNASRMGRSGV